MYSSKFIITKTKSIQNFTRPSIPNKNQNVYEYTKRNLIIIIKIELKYVSTTNHIYISSGLHRIEISVFLNLWFSNLLTGFQFINEELSRPLIWDHTTEEQETPKVI